MAGERPAFQLEGPCFTRHMLFRLMKEKNPRYADDSLESEQKWESITGAMQSFVNKISKSFSSSINIKLNHDKNEDTEYNIKRTVMLEIREKNCQYDEKNKFRARMRIDLYSESVGITIACDSFSKGKIFSCLRNISSIDDFNYVYKIWESNEPVFGEIDEHLSECFFKSEIFNGLIGDFRGLMLPADLNKKIINRKVDSISGQKINNVNNKHISPKIIDFFDRNGSIIDDFLDQKKSSASDSVLCSFLDGGVVYGAPLASKTLESSSYNCGIVNYIIIYDDLDGNQLGRLVRRLHILGELRYLALLDYKLENSNLKDLKNVSKALRKIGNSLDQYVEGNGNNPILPMKYIKSVNLSPSQISLISDGSLLYRIEQSRYYSGTFKDQIQDLRIKRIEGYQSYDQFIRRNVYQLFAKIDQIGRRYEALSKRIERWIIMSEADTSRKLLDNAENFATIFLVYYGGVIIEKNWYLINEYLGYKSSNIQFEYIWLSILLFVICDVMGNDKNITMLIYRIFRKILRFLFLPYRVFIKIFLSIKGRFRHYYKNAWNKISSNLKYNEK
jgi:hypothetical protein